MSVFWPAFWFGFLNGLLLWMRDYIWSEGESHVDQPIR